MALENSVVFLPVKDIEETTSFYRDIVGIPVVQEQSGGICRIFDTGYGYLGFCQYPDGRPIPGGPVGVCLSLNCHDEADVNSQYDRITKTGWKTECAPKYMENFPAYGFFMRDPNDYKVEFQFILLPDQQLMGGRRGDCYV